jgi:catechol 2,3-dioxygenase-like lactoylglutathione lyase family enzyme
MLVVVAVSGPAQAQLASPNDAGVAMGHLHYTVPDVEASRAFWAALGGRAAGTLGEATVVAVPDVLVLLTHGEAEGSAGSVVNHVAFRVPSFAAVEEAGLEVARLGGRFPGVGSVTSPEGERIELFEDAATNLTFTPDEGEADAVTGRHNRALDRPIAFHHIHLYVPDGQVAEAKAWYARAFGGVPGKRSTYDAVDLPGVNFNFSAAPQPAGPTSGRPLGHIGLEVADPDATCARLRAMGVICGPPHDGVPSGVRAAGMTDPWGTSIELTAGLRGR